MTGIGPEPGVASVNGQSGDVTIPEPEWREMDISPVDKIDDVEVSIDLSGNDGMVAIFPDTATGSTRWMRINNATDDYAWRSTGGSTSVLNSKINAENTYGLSFEDANRIVLADRQYKIGFRCDWSAAPRADVPAYGELDRQDITLDSVQFAEYQESASYDASIKGRVYTREML